MVDEESILIKNGDHSTHTSDLKGNFVHPFLTQPDHVQTIHYPDSSTFSVKLTQEYASSHKYGDVKTPPQSVEHHLLAPASEDTKVVLNYSDLIYSGNAYVGTASQKMVRVVFDTAYDHCLIDLWECSDCEAGKFDNSNSSTYTSLSNPASLPADLTKLYITDVQYSSDRICLADNASCSSNDFKFYGIKSRGSSVWPPVEYHGLVALGSGMQTGKSTLFVPSLHTSGVLSKNMFSVFIGQDVSDSYIDFGTPDVSIVGSEPWNDVKWVNIRTSSDYWENEVYGYRWGDGAEDQTTKTLDTKQAYLDSTGACI